VCVDRLGNLIGYVPRYLLSKFLELRIHPTPIVASSDAKRKRAKTAY
jgi:hypothetical protein